MFLLKVANALGYLHAKNIVHGRLCSRNVFMEHKIQLSLLDYAADVSNVVYSSPVLLQKWCNGFVHDLKPIRGRTSGDDVFAFGTLLYEIFSGRLPMAGESDVIIANRIRCGAMPNQLRNLVSRVRIVFRKRVIEKDMLAVEGSSTHFPGNGKTLS